jgi:dihydroxy-acid dehydratase
MHLLDLAGEIKKGVQEAGLIGYRFNTIGVSDGISMGTRGMSYSLQSRDLIADSVETVRRSPKENNELYINLFIIGNGRSMV